MKYDISKELFEAVCPDKIFKHIMYHDRIIFQFSHNGYETYMNINDFFFKCKKWALIKGYEISSKHNSYFIKYGKNTITPTILYTSEQQAVFDACQNILKYLNEQKELNE